MNFSIDDQRKLCQAGRYSLMDFSIITNPKYKPAWVHEEIAKYLEKVERGEIKRLILEVPPRFGKSQLATINFPAWYLGRHPDKEIITASYSGELAQEFGGKTRDLVSDEVYKLIFPEIVLKEDEQAKSKWKTNKGGSYISVGVGGSLTGRGANLLIIDDPIKNREEADSEVYRNKVWNWFTSTAYTRLEKDAAIILIQTRWHLDDLTGRVLAQEGNKWTEVKFPANEMLWPEKFSVDSLQEIRNVIGPYDYASLYMQSPILTENQEFKQEWFRPIERVEVERLNTRKYLTIDTALSDKDGADYTGFCENYIDQNNKWNLAAYRLRLNPKDLVDYIFSLVDKRGGFEKIGIEKTAYLVGLKPFLEEEMRKRGRFLNIIELQHNQTQKEIRIRGLIPRYSSGNINHIKGECGNLEEELLTFPKAINDDASDAAAYQLQVAEEYHDKYKFKQPAWTPASPYEG